MPHPITLTPVTTANWRAALALRVTPAQLPFVADHQPIAALALAKAHLRAMDHLWSPLLIQHGPTPVGFLALTHPESDPTQAWIFHFFIDTHHQRQGHASAAMVTLIAHPPATATHLNLLVNPANTPAQALYRAAGLTLTGQQTEGDLHMMRPLQRVNPFAV